MKTSPTAFGQPHLRGVLAFLVLVIVASLPSTLAAAAAAQESATRINPFEVVQAKDDSFTTSSVGTGGRLVLDLKDVPASYVVINRAFIDALGITDMTEAASWAPGQTYNPEIGMAANWNGGAIFGQEGQFVTRGLLGSTTANSGNAGGSSTTGMRNFYQNSNAGRQDSYAVETFDFGQGPNGILFSGAGTISGDFGSAGGLTGVSSGQTKRARLDASRTSIQTELGYWNYKRFTLDHNRPLTQNLGVRINLVELDNHAWIEHNETRKRGIHIAATWKISNSTDLTVEASNDYTMTHQIINNQETISGWDGRTVSRGLTDATMLPNTGVNAGGLSRAYGQILGASSALLWSGEPNGVERWGGNTDNYVFDMGLRHIINTRGMLVTRRADATSRTPLWTKTAPNGEYFVRGTVANTTIGGVNVISNPGFGVVQKSWLNTTGLPGDMFDRADAASLFRPWSINENNSFWGPGQENRTRDLQFAFSQQLGQKLAFGLGGDWNRNRGDGRTMDRHLNTVTLDINQLLPNGEPNPHFLDMVSIANGQFGKIGTQHSITVDMAVRANIAYNLDAGRFGTYSFNVNGNANTRSYDYVSLRVGMTRNIDPRKWGSNTENVGMLQYWGNNGTFYEPFTPTVHKLIDTTWSGTGSNTPTPSTSFVETRMVEGIEAHAYLIDNFRNQNIAFQNTGRWFNNKVIFLGGYRREKAETARQESVPAMYFPGIDPIFRPGGLVVPAGRWDGKTKFYKPAWTGTPQEFYSLKYQVRNAAGVAVGTPRLATTRPTTTSTSGGIDGLGLNGGYNIADPRYLTDQFRNDFSPPKSVTFGHTTTYGFIFNVTPWLAPFYNKSNQYIPGNTASLDILGGVREPIYAEGSDFGARFSFFRGKVTAKYNYFKTERTNEPSGNGVITNINTLINSNNWRDIDTTLGATDAINQLGIDPITNNGDSVTRYNNGYQIEITGQISQAFRLSINGSRGSTGQDAATFYPLTREYMADAARIEDFKRLLIDAGGSIDTTQKPFSNGAPVTFAPGLAIGTPMPGYGVGIDTTSAVNAYNNIWIQYDQLESNTTRTRNSPSANFFLDYTLQSGPVRGLRVGAGLQWQGERLIGNRGNDTIINPNNPLTAIDDPRYNNRDEVWVKGAMRPQLNFSYTFRMANSRTLAMGLRVNGLGQKPVLFGGVMRQPEGDLTKPNRVLMQAGDPYGIQEPVNFRLTATYSFMGGLGSRR